MTKTPRDRIVERARVYADDCSRLMAEANAALRAGGRTAQRTYERRLAAAGMMHAQALGLLIAAQILDGDA